MIFGFCSVCGVLYPSAGACREGQQIWHGRDHQRRHDHSQCAENGLHRAGEKAEPEGLRLALALGIERHGDDRSLREVLDGDTQRQSQRTARRDVF